MSVFDSHSLYLSDFCVTLSHLYLSLRLSSFNSLSLQKVFWAGSLPKAASPLILLTFRVDPQNVFEINALCVSADDDDDAGDDDDVDDADDDDGDNDDNNDNNDRNISDRNKMQ